MLVFGRLLTVGKKSPRTDQLGLRRLGEINNGAPCFPGGAQAADQHGCAGSLMDGITVMGFACVNDVEDYLTSSDYADISVGERAMTDASLSEYWTAVNYSVINRLYPEVATAR